MFATGTNWSIIIDFLAPVCQLECWFTMRPEQVQRVWVTCVEAGMGHTKNSNVGNISRPLRSEGRFFFRKPPAPYNFFTGPLSCPHPQGVSRQGTDATQTVQVVVGEQFKGNLECRSLMNRMAPSHAPCNAWKARAAGPISDVVQ